MTPQGNIVLVGHDHRIIALLRPVNNAKVSFRMTVGDVYNMAVADEPAVQFSRARLTSHLDNIEET